MSVLAPTEAEWKLVVDLLEERFGLSFDGVRRDFLASRLLPRLDRLRLRALGEYYRYLRGHPAREEELAQLKVVVTNNETYFFRESAQVDALVREVLPRHTRRGGAPLRVLSAGCSSGEEAYSIAIALRNAAAVHSEVPWSIDACDLNPARIVQARTATYDEPSLRACDAATRLRYFSASSSASMGTRFCLQPRHRQGVHFFEANLAGGFPAWPAEATHRYDAIFCRNVLIYFSERALQRAVSLLVGLLTPNGHLFLGHSESLMHRRVDVVPVRLGDVIVYARREAA